MTARWPMPAISAAFASNTKRHGQPPTGESVLLCRLEREPGATVLPFWMRGPPFLRFFYLVRSAEVGFGWYQVRRPSRLRRRFFRHQGFVIDPQQQRAQHAHSDYRPPHLFRLVRNLAEMVNQLPSEPSRDQ